MSDDPDLVITSVDPSLGKISKHELRRKLISFLAVSLPPVPLSYVTFEAHVKAQCETYYDSVIKEVFESLTAQWNRRLDRVENDNEPSSSKRVPEKIDPITISSDDESESEELATEQRKPEECESEERKSEVCESEERESDECEHEEHESDEPAPAAGNTCDDSVPPTPGCSEGTRAITVEELIAFKAEKSTKKYTRYLQETYDLIKNIEETTSCNICCKLKRRIQKFVSLVGQESAIIQQKVAKELRAHRISPKGSLTEAALEKMRMSILIDKLIEISMPDILKGVEMMEPKSDDGPTSEECETKEKTSTGKKKGKKKSRSDSSSADGTEVIASCSTEPSNGAVTKKRSKKNSISQDVEMPSLVTKSLSHKSVNGSCSGSEGHESKKKSTAKKKGKKKSDAEETPIEVPRAKARKISIKIRDSSHPDLN